MPQKATLLTAYFSSHVLLNALKCKIWTLLPETTNSTQNTRNVSGAGASPLTLQEHLHCAPDSVAEWEEQNPPLLSCSCPNEVPHSREHAKQTGASSLLYSSLHFTTINLHDKKTPNSNENHKWKTTTENCGSYTYAQKKNSVNSPLHATDKWSLVVEWSWQLLYVA